MASLTKRQKILLTFLVIIILALPVGVYLTQKTQIFKPRAQEVQVTQQDTLESLTNQLLQVAAEQTSQTQDISARRDQPQTLIQIAQKRKDKALEEIQINPNNFLLFSIPKQAKDQLPSDIKPLIEDEATVSGKLDIIHGDDFTNHKSTYNWIVETSDTQRFNVHFGTEPSSLISSPAVRVEGGGKT